MKKILAITLAGAMILSLAACAKSEAPAETEAAAVTEAATETPAEAATEAAEETEDSDTVKFFKDNTLSGDADDYIEGEKFNDQVTAYYIDKKGLTDIVMYKVPTEGQTLEENEKGWSEKRGGCWDIVDQNGTALGIHSTLECIGGENLYCTSYTIEDGDYFYVRKYRKHVKEIQLGATSTCIYLPKTMQQIEDKFDEELFGPHLLAAYRDESFGNMVAYLYEFDADGFKYDREKTMCEAYGYEMLVDEDYFNELAKDGFTTEEIGEYYEAYYGDEVVESYEVENAGMTENVIEIVFDEDGTLYTAVILAWVDEGKIHEIYLAGPADKWESMGEAVAMSIHKK